MWLFKPTLHTVNISVQHMTDKNSFNPKRKIGDHSGTPRIFLPKQVISYLGSEPGDLLRFEPTDDGVLLTAVDQEEDQQ